MGAPKALLAWRGRTFIEHVVAALQACVLVQEVWLLGDGPAPASLSALPRIADALPTSEAPRSRVEGSSGRRAGPLFGILAAVRARPDATWVIAACDQPLIRPEAVKWLLAQRGKGVVAVLPRVSPSHVEPLLALYGPELLPRLESLAQSPHPSLQDLADAPGVRTPAPPAALRACWQSVNTPEEMQALAAQPGP